MMSQLKTWVKFNSSAVYEEAIERGAEALKDEAEKAIRDTFIRALRAPSKSEVLHRGLAISQHLFDEAPDGADAATVRHALTSALTQLHPTFAVAHRASLTANRLGCIIGASVGVDRERDLHMAGSFTPHLYEDENEPTRDGIRALWPRMYMDERIAMRWALQGDHDLLSNMLQAPWPNVGLLTEMSYGAIAAFFSLRQDGQRLSMVAPLTWDERDQVVQMEALRKVKGETSIQEDLTELLGDNFSEAKLIELWAPYCRCLLESLRGIDLKGMLAYQQSSDGRRFAKVLEKTAAQTDADQDALIARAKRERTQPSIFAMLEQLFQ